MLKDCIEFAKGCQ